MTIKWLRKITCGTNNEQVEATKIIGHEKKKQACFTSLKK